MADRLMPSPRREDKVARSRLGTEHLGRWKNIQSHLKGASDRSIPARRSTPSEPVEAGKDLFPQLEQRREGE